ncbi:MAG: protein-disulfide reductase DsbD domain-containing protein, partial [Bacteroidota bacterium]
MDLIRRTLLLALSALLASSSLQSQIVEPVSWSFTKEEISPQVYDLKFTAQIDEGWAIYGTDLESGGPVATGFDFNESEDYSLIDEMKTPSPKVKYDPNFEMELSMFDMREVTFTQRVELTSDEPVRVTGELVFMACNDNSCL